ncbi:homoserine kinase [Caballeronia telluris]|jgi:homoserine kinase type II|uniref:Homoserine kinase n=1 Tax=Caballeronia telluris TaxID=326475 RepID=A0A158K0X5_9BURK|nr:homoserine kinase [Caballeronia telluris]SAL74615.1 homoserine kinase [Caballeronia telluris]
MAVFTPVTASQLEDWLQDYDLGDVVDFRGIQSGIENSNFFLTTTHGQYVLTIFENLTATQLPFYLDLMRHLASHRVPVPDPMPRRDGALFATLNGKPATIVTKLEGTPELAPTPAHCIEVGQMLARLHLAGRDFPQHQHNLRSLAWWRENVPAILSFLTDDQRALIETELAHQTAFFGSADYASLPEGPCHCDLFRDNVLFAHTADHARLGGFFDFYFAGVDKWLFDVAVCVNDWCIDLATGVLDPKRVDAMLRAYQTVRPFTPAEERHWNDMLRAGALRFWVSRLYDFYRPREAEMLKPHDPGHFERILRERVNAAPHPASR